MHPVVVGFLRAIREFIHSEFRVLFFFSRRRGELVDTITTIHSLSAAASHETFELPHAVEVTPHVPPLALRNSSVSFCLQLQQYFCEDLTSTRSASEGPAPLPRQFRGSGKGHTVEAGIGRHAPKSSSQNSVSPHVDAAAHSSSVGAELSVNLPHRQLPLRYSSSSSSPSCYCISRSREKRKGGG